LEFEWNEEKRQKILRRRGAVEINRTVRRQVLHGRLDVARRRDPGDFDEAKP
jgi:hypothetical protein